MPLPVRLLYRLLMKPLTPDRLLRDGDMVGGLRVMHIPGHTPGSIALVRDDGVVFSGDALLSDKHGNVLPPSPRLAEDPDQAARSAEAVQALPPRLLLPGHGSPAAASRATATGAHLMATSDTGTASGGHARRLLRRFDRFVQRKDILVDRYGGDTAVVMRQEMREELARLIPQVPYVGRRRENPLAPQLYRAAWAVASYRVVLARGGTLEDAGELIHHLTRAEVERLPRALRPLLRRYLFSGLRRRQAQKEARWSQERRYPDDWVYHYVPGNGTGFELGRDYTECAIVKFLHAQGADELCPYLCDTDYITAEVMGVGFTRTKTLGWGCDRCDFRYSKNGSTTAAWPPRFVERTCGQAPTTQPESIRASTAR